MKSGSDDGGRLLNSVWDDDAANYASRRNNWLNKRRLNHVTNYILALKPQRVLEIGSGTGSLLFDLAKEFPQIEFTGVEPLLGYVEYAQTEVGAYGLSNIKFIQGTAETLTSLGFREQFNLILSNDMLHHVSSDERILQQVKQVCAPRAEWLAFEPNVLNPYVLIKQATRVGERNFLPKRFISTANRLGWVQKNRQYLFLLPPFVKEPPTVLKIAEKAFEKVPIFAGEIALSLVLSG